MTRFAVACQTLRQGTDVGHARSGAGFRSVVQNFLRGPMTDAATAIIGLLGAGVKNLIAISAGSSQQPYEIPRRGWPSMSFVSGRSRSRGCEGAGASITLTPLHRKASFLCRAAERAVGGRLSAYKAEPHVFTDVRHPIRPDLARPQRRRRQIDVNIAVPSISGPMLRLGWKQRTLSLYSCARSE